MTPQEENPRMEKSALERDPTRLCADPSSDCPWEPSSQWALSLLGQAIPYQSPLGRKERVRSLLHATRPYRSTRLRLAFAAVLMVTCAAFTSAALAQWPAWLAQAIERIVPGVPDAPAVATPTTVVKRQYSVPSERLPEYAPVPASSPSELALPSRAMASDDASSVARPRRVLKPALPASEDMEALLTAMRALRVEQNPLRARALLTVYLDHHPKNELSEEALVMLIEAAVAHHDRDASALGARYFKLYPRGPFRGLVERNLAAATKKD